ncbi:MAG TPA: glycine cleavage system protein GcvH [Phototrophicaceae bacterium]|nr:glycine cleavage system protein GcvH [Phototrophicaceae bacterium]
MGNWKTPAELKYTKNDEWLRLEGSTGTMGLSDYAQDQLNDIVYVDLPEVGDALKKGSTFCSIESVKAASDVFAPVSGKITEVNAALEDEPELINSDPYGKGWIIKFDVSNVGEAGDLMDATAYAEYCNSRE